MTAGNRKHPARPPQPVEPPGTALWAALMLAPCAVIVVVLAWLAVTVLPDAALAFWPFAAALAVTGATALIN